MKRKRGQRRPSRPLDDLEVLTQFGCASNPQGRFGGICRSEPRNFEDALSLIRGDLSVAEAASRVRPSGENHEGDVVRKTRVGELRRLDFTVEHSPTKRNPDHVSVYRNGEWGIDECRTFEDAFGEPTVPLKVDTE